MSLVIVSKNPLEDILRPKRLANWELPIITDVAEVKPTVTGIEIKSTRTPERRKEF